MSRTKRVSGDRIVMVDPVASVSGIKLTLEDDQETLVVMFSSKEKLRHLVSLLVTWTSEPTKP